MGLLNGLDALVAKEKQFYCQWFETLKIEQKLEYIEFLNRLLELEKRPSGPKLIALIKANFGSAPPETTLRRDIKKHECLKTNQA